ncbi:MAG: hypothetical protein AMXMBFR4_13070 [Candidatus Hydrogenedentota bacterium]
MVCSDAYRHTGVDRLLPTLVEELNGAGVRDESIHFFFASGTHKPPAPPQMERILGAGMYARFATRTHTHDPYNASLHKYVGSTTRGTPVEINCELLEFDRIILTGAVVLHYFAGFGGGRKSIVPGLASARTIAHNHSLNLDPVEPRMKSSVRIGALDGNPVAEDMLEAARLVPVHGIINTVLNRQGEIAGVFVGEIDAAHRAATALARSLFVVPIRERADLVIASAGDAANYVQSHKALYNAYQAVKPSGHIILLAPCPEGLGGEHIVKWLRRGSVNAIVEGLRRQSEIYGQTALSTLQKTPITTIVTGMSDGEVALLHAARAATLEGALEQARATLGENATYYVMPSAVYTVPVIE